MSRKKPWIDRGTAELDAQTHEKISAVCELKPCPFCGGKAEVVKIPEGLNYEGLYVAGCDDDMLCYGNINHFTMIFVCAESAAEAWNRRADDEQRKAD